MATSESDPFSGVITARDVYDATRETQSAVLSAVGRMDRMEQAQESIRQEQDRHRARLDAIDQWRYALPLTAFAAAIAAIAAIISAFLNYLG